MNRPRVLLLLVFGCVHVVGCAPPRVCVPGQTMQCLGAAACTGAQACLADGSGYGSCDCGPANMVDAGTRTDAGNPRVGPLRPNVLFLVERSGNLGAPLNPSHSSCTPGCGSSSSPCPSGCPTIVSELRRGMYGFLSQYGSILRLGLVTYPVDNSFGTPQVPDVALPAASDSDDQSALLAANAEQIDSVIGSMTLSGGRPTGAAIGYASALPDLNADDGRADVIVLITSGIPNGNANNPNSVCSCNPSVCGDPCTTVCAAQVEACRCTTATCGVSTVCARGCADEAGTVVQLLTARDRGVKTAVVAYGPGWASAPETSFISSAASAGGFGPAVRAADAAQLQAGLTTIAEAALDLSGP